MENLEVPPIKPLYFQGNPSDKIELGKRAVQFELKGNRYDDVADVFLNLTSKCSLEFRISLENKPQHLLMQLCFEPDNDLFELMMTDENIPVVVFVSHTDENHIFFTPTHSEVPVTSATDKIRKVIFHVFNFPSCIGPNDFILTTGSPPNQRIQRCDRLVMNADGWGVTITGTEQLRSRREAKNSSGGYLISHVGAIVREDGNDFSADDLDDFFTCLHHFASFALGRWAGISLPVGMDANGARIYERGESAMSRRADGMDRYRGLMLTTVSCFRRFLLDS